MNRDLVLAYDDVRVSNRAELEYEDFYYILYNNRSVEFANEFDSAYTKKLTDIAHSPYAFTKVYRVNKRSRIRWTLMSKYKITIYYSIHKGKREILVHSVFRWGQSEKKIPGYNKKYFFSPKLKKTFK